MIESAVTLLPEPDSPTIATVSRGPISNEIPLTTVDQTSSTRNDVVRLRTERTVIRANRRWMRAKGRPERALHPLGGQRAASLFLLRAWGSSSLAFESGVDSVAQAVAEQVQREDHYENRNAGHQCERVAVEDVLEAFADHPAPGRRRRLDAQPHEGERCFRADGVGEPERAHDQDLGQDVGQDMSRDDAHIGVAERAA